MVASKRMSALEKSLLRTYDKPLRVINDFMFKAVFAPREHEPQLRELLNELLGYEGNRRITRLTHLDGVVHARRRKAKQPIMDLLVEDLRASMGQLGCSEVSQLRSLDRKHPGAWPSSSLKE